VTLRNFFHGVKNVLAVSVLMALLASCAGGAQHKQDETLQYLETRAAKIVPTAFPPMSREEVQQTYQDLVSSTENVALKAIALQRLADMELESQQVMLADDEPSAEKRDSSEEAGGQDEAEDVDAEEKSIAQEKAVHRSAIFQYERLLELYPDYVGNDRVMYQLARAYEMEGELEKTLDLLTQLIARYPNQKNAEEIQFRRGEILFAFRDFEQSEKAYQSVLLAGSQGMYYGRSLFKHGWSVFKQGDTRRSLNSYFRVLDRSFADGRQLSDFSRSELELLDDTLRIVSLSFSYLKGPETIQSFFKEYGSRDYEFRIYERLADLYLLQDRTSDAVATLSTFVSVYPQHRQAPLFMVRVIDAFRQTGHLKELLRAKADLVVGYGIGTVFWKKHDDQLLAQVRPHVKSNLDDLSRYYHAQAQKTKRPQDYRIAAYWYRLYAHSFPNDPTTPEKNMLLAESLLDSGDRVAAAAEFETTAYSYPTHKASAEAGYAALLAHRQQAASLKGKAQLRERRIAISSAKRFVASFSNDKRAVAVMSKAAEELLVLKDYSQAVGTAHYVVGSPQKPSAKLLKINWAIIATAEFELGMYPEAEAATRQRLRFATPAGKDRNKFMERLAAAIYKQGEQARAAGQQVLAAEHFLRVGKLAPKSSIRTNADYDAATALFASKNWAAAIPVLKTFIRRYPSHKLRAGADEKLALSYQSQGDWRKAADAYEVLYRKETNSEKKRKLLWQMAEFYEKAKRIDDARQIYKRYVAAFPMPFDEAIEARHRLASIYKKKGQISSRHYWLKKIMEADKKGPATNRSHFLAAAAALELAGPSYVAFRSVKLVPPLKANLKKKKKLMQASIHAYTDAADYGIAAVTTASTFRIAQIYGDFGQGLFDSERPKGLSPDELEQYDILLEEQAYPFEEKAIEIHEVNAQHAFDGVYDKWVKRSFSALAKLSPVRFAKAEKSEEWNDVIY